MVARNDEAVPAFSQGTKPGANAGAYKCLFCIEVGLQKRLFSQTVDVVVSVWLRKPVEV